MPAKMLQKKAMNKIKSLQFALGQGSAAKRRWSKPGDVCANLHWSIQSLVHWEEVIRKNSVAGVAAGPEQEVPEVQEEAQEVKEEAELVGAEDAADEARPEEEEPMLKREGAGPEGEAKSAQEAPRLEDAYLLHGAGKPDRSTGPGKIIFLHQLLNKLVGSALRCSKLRTRLKFLEEEHVKLRAPLPLRVWRSLSCGAAPDDEAPVAAFRKQQEIEACKETLVEALGNFDIARATATWLLRDYALVTKKRLLKEEQGEAHAELEATKAAGGAEEKALKDMEKKARDKDNELSRVTSDLLDNDRDSIILGLNFLDANSSGFIEPEDLPALTAKQFMQLDLDCNHKISPSELVRAVAKTLKEASELEAEKTKLQRTVAQDNARLEVAQQQARALAGADKEEAEFQAETLEAEVARKDMRRNQIEAKISEHGELLASVDENFRRAFLANVWDKLVIKEDPSAVPLEQQLHELNFSIAKEDELDPLMEDLDLEAIPGKSAMAPAPEAPEQIAG